MNGEGKLELPGETQTSERAPRQISVMLNASDDSEKDSLKLRRIHNVLIQYHGIDQFIIVIRRGDASTPLAFPDKTTNICAALLDELTAIVGEQAVIIEDNLD